MAEDNTADLTAPKLPGKPFLKGDDPRRNLEGRPVGSGISITNEIKKKLAEVPEGQKATYLELLINRIFKQAIQDGDERMITRIWQYIDGMPKGMDFNITENKILILPSEIIQKYELNEPAPDTEVGN